MVYPLTNLPSTLDTREYLGVSSSEVTKLIRPGLKKFLSKAIIFQPVTVRNQEEFELHRILRCIDHNILLSTVADGRTL